MFGKGAPLSPFINHSKHKLVQSQRGWHNECDQFRFMQRSGQEYPDAHVSAFAHIGSPLRTHRWRPAGSLTLLAHRCAPMARCRCGNRLAQGMIVSWPSAQDRRRRVGLHQTRRDNLGSWCRRRFASPHVVIPVRPGHFFDRHCGVLITVKTRASAITVAVVSCGSRKTGQKEAPAVALTRADLIDVHSGLVGPD